MLTHSGRDIERFTHPDGRRYGLINERRQAFFADRFQHCLGISFIGSDMTGYEFVGLLFEEVHYNYLLLFIVRRGKVTGWEAEKWRLFGAVDNGRRPKDRKTGRP